VDKKLFTVQSNAALAAGVYAMRLSGDTSGITAPGQFVNIALDGFYLRRPISVCDWDEGSLLLIYKAVGHGTEYMSALGAGAQLDLLTGLGNGYDTERAGKLSLLIGGGAGVPPMYALAKKLQREGKNYAVLLGFNGTEDSFGIDMFKALGAPVLVSTADGSIGKKGFVTDLVGDAGDFDYSFACGPEPMLKAVYNALPCGGQYSFEERMGCGFGACMGCTCQTKYGAKRICRDGPVLDREEIIW
jgi:dihydroorotate dehydrogenase electron transfer subunit